MPAANLRTLTMLLGTIGGRGWDGGSSATTMYRTICESFNTVAFSGHGDSWGYNLRVQYNGTTCVF